MTTNENEFIRFNALITACNPGYEPYYFPLNPNSKDPIEGISWKNNRLTFEQAKEKLNKGFNIGIAATDKDQLVIMDKDDLEKVGPSKPTLTVTSRKRTGRHCFYITDDPLSKSIFDNSAKQNIATEDYGEIRANWQYVVCAGSYVPVPPEELEKIPENDRINAGKYTVSEEMPVNIISYDELPQVYRDCLNEKRENEIKVKIDKEQKPHQTGRDGLKSALYNLSIQDVTGKNESGTKRFSSLFHGSDTGKNTSISKGLLHCWRHNVSHTPLTALAVISGIGSCGSVGYGHNGCGTSSLDLNDGETVFKLWEYAKKEGIISKDDPIPSKALVWYAVKNKICESSQIRDEWKLPLKAYNLTIETLGSEGISVGRSKIQHDNFKTNIKISSENYRWSDVGNGKRLVKLFGVNIRYCHPWGMWLIWNDRLWEKDNTAEIQRMCKKTVENMFMDAFNIEDADKKKDFLGFCLKCESKSKLEAMASCASSEIGVPVLPDALDKDPWLFNVQNGTIDLKTGKIQPHKQTDMITKISPVFYNAEATAPIWESFLNTTFQNNKNIIRYIQRKCGYILTGETNEEDLDILFGTGNNGKSKLTGILVYILGDYHKKMLADTIQETKNKNGSSASPDIASLKGARLVTVSEPEKGMKLNESKVKDMTGRDIITARHLHQEPFDFLPEFKLWIYTNHKPIIRGQDRGIWRRIKLIPFEHEVLPEDMDLQLDKKLESEAPGILNWMIKGCIDWHKDGLQVPEEILEATADYKEEMDVFSEFFGETCNIKKDNKEYLATLYLVYKAWCKMKEIIPYSNKKFLSNLVERGYKKLPKDNKGIIVAGVTLNDRVKTVFEEVKSLWGEVESDAVTHMTQYFISFSNSSFMKGNSENSITCVTPSLLASADSDKVQQSKLEIVTHANVCHGSGLPINSVTENIEKCGRQWEEIKCVVGNSSNLTEAIFWVCDKTQKTPEEVKPILERLFKILPESDKEVGLCSCGSPGYNISESSTGKKEYFCDKCYHEKHPFLPKP